MTAELSRILDAARRGQLPDGVNAYRALRELASEVDRCRFLARPPLTEDDRRELRLLRLDARTWPEARIALDVLLRHFGVDDAIPSIPARAGGSR